MSALLSDELKLCAKSHGRKEPHFFTKENIDDRDFLHYIHGFEVAKMHMGVRLTLDSTPKYFRTPEVWDRIRRIYSRECLREKKFILSLREPTVRELSSFNQYHGMCKKRNLRMCPYHYTVDFNDTLHDYIDRHYRRVEEPSGDGFYIRNIKSLLRIKSRDQLFILSFESLIDDRQIDTINRLLKFIGEPPVNSTKGFFPHLNPRVNHYTGESGGFPYRVLCTDVEFLRDMFSKANEGLLEFINSDPNRPVFEPEFLPFQERLPTECIDDASIG